MNVDLPGFDFQNGIYYYNVGEEPYRNWDDYCKYGFITAGQGLRWRDAMLGFQTGDIVVAYLKNYGFVGIGKITQRAKMISKVYINDKKLHDLDLKCKGMSVSSDNAEKSEYVALVEWIKTFKRDKSKWERKSGLYTTQHVRASLSGQPKTLKYIEDRFNVDITS